MIKYITKYLPIIISAILIFVWCFCLFLVIKNPKYNTNANPRKTIKPSAVGVILYKQQKNPAFLCL